MHSISWNKNDDGTWTFKLDCSDGTPIKHIIVADKDAWKLLEAVNEARKQWCVALCVLIDSAPSITA